MEKGLFQAEQGFRRQREACKTWLAKWAEKFLRHFLCEFGNLFEHTHDIRECEITTGVSTESSLPLHRKASTLIKSPDVLSLSPKFL